VSLAMISLQQTDTEFLLYIPASQRDRAKRIFGRVWDPRRKCWAIPRTRRAYSDLVLEFGDEIRLGPFADGKTERRATPGPADASSDDVLKSVAKIPRPGSPEVLTPPNRLGEKELELQSLRSEVKQLREQLASRGKPVAVPEVAPSESRGSKDGSLAPLLQALFPADKNVSSLLSAIQRDPDLPMKIVRSLEGQLRAALKDTDNTSLFELIAQAGESNLLTEEAVDFAHLLRKQRNRIVHGDSGMLGSRSDRDPSLLARNLMCVCAARLLITALRQGSQQETS
jgi:hypothetical protein